MSVMDMNPIYWGLIGLYGLIWAVLAVFGAHRIWMSLRYRRHRHERPAEPAPPTEWPRVLVQLPLFNERYVAERLIRAVAAFDYPRDRLTIQVLDDSTDDTPGLIAPIIAELREGGLAIDHVRRPDRTGYKAGALAWGMRQAPEAEFVAIFDADFVPKPDFLLRTVPHFADPAIGMVQTRWDYLNREASLLTRVQGVMLDGHFVIEHTARHRSGLPFNFNGTAGIWRRATIEDAGGWEHDTLTEDLDLSFRAVMRGWRHVYRGDLASPSELPVEMTGFKSQQRRWSQGAIQTARKLLGRIWRSDLPTAARLDMSFNMLNHICFPLMVLMALMVWPASFARTQLDTALLMWIDVPLFITTTLAIGLFYPAAQMALGHSLLRSLIMLPGVMALGIGIAPSNTMAVGRGLRRMGGEFVRTPKYRLDAEHARWAGAGYHFDKARRLPWAETLLCFYSLGGTTWAVGAGVWVILPFMLLFNFGLGYVALRHWGEVLPGSGPAAPEPEAAPATIKAPATEL